MKKSKYQQYFCFVVHILVPYAIWFSSQQNVVTIRLSTTFRGALLRGKRLFQCGYPKVWHLLEGDAYLRPGAYLRKYVMSSLLASDEIPENFSCRTETKNGHFGYSDDVSRNLPLNKVSCKFDRHENVMSYYIGVLPQE